MSTKIQKDIVCPACGQTQKLEMYTSVNAEENPELRRDILRESMFDWECLHCGYTAQMAYPMIYHDPMNAFMICLRPSGAVSGAEPIPAVRALKKRSVKNPQELKEKILIFEAGLDDAAVELVKNAIVTVVRKIWTAMCTPISAPQRRKSCVLHCSSRVVRSPCIRPPKWPCTASRRRFCARSITNPRTISPSSTPSSPKAFWTNISRSNPIKANGTAFCNGAVFLCAHVYRLCVLWGYG